jgi:hypothetical protein
VIYPWLVIILLHSWQGKFACTEATKYNLCYTTQAIMIEESSVCRFRYGDDGKSLGCMQISLGATRRVFPTFPKTAWRSLATEDALNISVGVSYLNWCIEQMGSWSRGVVCYNAGPSFARDLTPWQVQHFPYLRAISEYVILLEHKEPGLR